MDALDERVLVRLIRLDDQLLDAVPVDPTDESLDDRCRTAALEDCLASAEHLDQLIQHANHARRRNQHAAFDA